MSQQGVITNLNNMVFNKGYMYGTISGHTADAIAFGGLQNVKIAHSWTRVEAEGPESLSPVGVGIKSESLTGTFSYLAIHPEQYVMMIGGSMSYDTPSDDTTYTKKINEEPLPFNLKCQSALSNPELKVTLFNCLADNMNVFSGDNRAWVMGDGGFRAYGESGLGDAGRLFTVDKPGNLTNSS